MPPCIELPKEDMKSQEMYDTYRRNTGSSWTDKQRCAKYDHKYPERKRSECCDNPIDDKKHRENHPYRKRIPPNSVIPWFSRDEMEGKLNLMNKKMSRHESSIVKYTKNQESFWIWAYFLYIIDMQKSSFSLALWGGWARWLAHIGVIRYLEEHDMFPQALAGTSMGAIVAALMALWKSSHDMEDILKDIKWLSLLDFDMKKWLIKWAKIEKFLDILFEWKRFSDTQTPLFITATDVDTGEAVVFREGKLSHAVRASIGIPGVFSPFHHSERYLIDGGLTQNLPIELLPEGKVIAVSAMRDLSRKLSYKRRVFSLDWQKTIFSNGYNILQKTIDIMLSQNESRSLSSRKDIVSIRPAFDGLDYYEFHKYHEFIISGYQKAKDVL